MKTLSKIIGIVVLLAFFACEDETQAITPVPSPPVEDLDRAEFATEVSLGDESQKTDKD